MKPEHKFNEITRNSANQDATKVCPQCGAPMPGEMRFCRSCGQRLGEGPAEYTETVRFGDTTAPANGRRTSPFIPGVGAPMARQTCGAFGRRRRRVSGMTWIWIAMAIFFASGGGLSMLVKNVRRPPGFVATAARSYVGVDGFDSANGGVTFGNVEPPGSPADLAGLVGGDIITSFDGRVVKDEDEMRDLLAQTPPGKTVEVVYTRDGEEKKTQLTTIDKDSFNQLERAFANRPEGVGRLKFDTSDAHRVALPNTKVYGVRLDNFDSSGPAALAGIQKGDIITAIDKVPIRTVSELVARVHRAFPYSTVRMQIVRGNEELEIPVKLGK